MVALYPPKKIYHKKKYFSTVSNFKMRRIQFQGQIICWQNKPDKKKTSNQNDWRLKNEGERERGRKKNQFGELNK